MTPRDYAVKITVRNNRFLEQMRAAGFETSVALSRACGVTTQTISAFMSLRRAPLGHQHGNWSEPLLKISNCLRCLPEDLFPTAHLTKPLKTNKAEFTADASDIHQISASLRSLALPADEKMMISESKQVLDGLLQTLSPREERVLRLRFGLVDGNEHTLKEIAQEYDVCGNRIMQVEAKALRKLRQAVRINRSIARELGRGDERPAPSPPPGIILRDAPPQASCG